MAQLNHEPSMEDILASIKRIIAEDSEAAGARGTRVRREMASVPPARQPDPIDDEAEDAPEATIGNGTVSSIHQAFAAAPEMAEPLAEDDIHDVLELTSPIEEVRDERSADPAPIEPEVAAAATETAEAAPVATAELAPEPTSPTEAPVLSDPLMSDPAAQASRNAFAALSQMQVRAEAGQENSLEGLVSDLLRPMLREWLDREMPALVEKLVSAEISRISGR